MEKTWEDFYRTGKVTDYLSYRNSVKEESAKEQGETDVRGSSDDRHGAKGHAHWRL